MTVLCCARNSSSTAQLRPGVVSSDIAKVKKPPIPPPQNATPPLPAGCRRPHSAILAHYTVIPATLRRHSRHPTPPFPTPSHCHSRPHPVIPTKAGIHTPTYANPKDTGVLDSGLRRNDGGAARPTPTPRLPGFWIPACAGMTVGRGGLRATGVLDSGLRRNDGGVAAAYANPRYTGVLDSGLRRNDGGAARPMPTPRIPGFWIPACAGMTVEWRRPPIPRPLTPPGAAPHS